MDGQLVTPNGRITIGSEYVEYMRECLRSGVTARVHAGGDNILQCIVLAEDIVQPAEGHMFWIRGMLTSFIYPS